MLTRIRPGRALLWVYMGLAIAALVVRPLYYVSLALMVWMMFRIFSKNIYKRYFVDRLILRKY